MACTSFEAAEGEEIIVKTAASAVSTAGATLNLQELNGMTFDRAAPEKVFLCGSRNLRNIGLRK